MLRPLNSNATELHHIETHLQASLGPALAVVCSGTDGDPSLLSADEWSAVSAATPKRQREFAAGRTAARAALCRLGYLGAPIPANTDRSPCWPTGIVGSISHTSNICLAIVGRQSSYQAIGVDIEPVCGIEEPLWPIISTTEELQQIRVLPPSEQNHHAKRIFVAKEAFFKWHYPQRGLLFDFLSASVHWHEGESGFSVTTQPHLRLDTMTRIKGSFFRLEDHWIAICASSAHPSNQDPDRVTA